MKSEWKDTNLKSLLSFSNGRSSPERADDLPFPVYGSNGIIGRSNEVNANANSIIIGRVGSYCGSVYLSRSCCWVTDNAITAEAVNGNDPRYLFYLLASLHLNHWRSGSGQPLLNQSILNSIEVSTPPPAIQRRIAHILGSLDDKIELSRRMNRTLEEMAKALFKSWFVDFDPVHANAVGNPVLPPDLAAVFPAEFEPSPIGNVPKGWKVDPLGDIIELAYGRPLKAANRINGNVEVYGSNGIVGCHNDSLVKGPGIVVGRKGNPGVVTWAHDDFFPIDTTFYVVPTAGCKSLHFIYEALLHQKLASLSADSAVPGLNRNHAYARLQVIPNDCALERFNDVIVPLFARIAANTRESIRLAATRDVLLPALLNGDLGVPHDGAVE